MKNNNFRAAVVGNSTSLGGVKYGASKLTLRSLGEFEIASAIVRTARRYGVPVVEQGKFLNELEMNNAEVDGPIPEELWQLFERGVSES